MSDNERERVTTRIESKLRQQIEIKAAESRVSDQEMYNTALREWLAGKGVKVPAASPYLDKHRVLHDKLEAILNSGDQSIIDAVVPNIEVFHDRMKPRDASQHKQKKGA